MHMRLSVATLVGLLLALFADTWAQAAQPTTSFRAGVDLVSVDVTVNDMQRRLVTDLERDDFVVFEDNRPQEITLFQRSGVPLAVSLLLDTSASMQDRLAFAQDAAIGFVDALRPVDVASVVDFDSRVEVVQGLTGDLAALRTAIRRPTAGGSTALYNALYVALRELDRQTAGSDAQLRRRAIVLLSDGEDTSSLMTFEEVLEATVRSGTAVYAIGLGSGWGAPGASRSERMGQYNLRRLAQQTGGRAFFPLQAHELRSVYREILDELSNQYTLAYESTNKRRNGEYRRIAVRVQRPGVTTRARPGYYSPSR